MAKSNEEKSRLVRLLPVRQWLPGWNRIDFDPEEHRAKPPERFFLFSLPARELKSLTGIVRREAKGGAPRTDDLGIQRQHDPERSDEIRSFVEFGYPWSTLSEAKRQTAEFNDLRKPGWLPTAIVINILTKGAQRNGGTIAEADLVTVLDNGDEAALRLPYEKWDSSWFPSRLPPFEVIDGQHRLWAFQEAGQLENFDLPVVAFVGLDISWQAYLFWTINIKPKRINPSLAFDLYPLLRSEDWLDRAEGHAVYRETRAQELTELIWSYPESPWYDRVNMLGEKQNPWVTQSAWIKSLMASFVRQWDRRRGKSGGLFGGRSQREEVLGWTRAQQGAFLIFVWQALRAAVAKTKEPWATDLRRGEVSEDLAFYGRHTLINTDQGVRGYLQIVNDLCYLRAGILRLNHWVPDEMTSADPVKSVASALDSLKKQEFASFLTSIAVDLATFDWRTSSAPDLEELLRRSKLVFRGSSGYKELRSQLLEHLAARAGLVAEAAKAAARVL